VPSLRRVGLRHLARARASTHIEITTFHERALKAGVTPRGGRKFTSAGVELFATGSIPPGHSLLVVREDGSVLQREKAAVNEQTQSRSS